MVWFLGFFFHLFPHHRFGNICSSLRRGGSIPLRRANRAHRKQKRKFYVDRPLFGWHTSYAVFLIAPVTYWYSSFPSKSDMNRRSSLTRWSVFSHYWWLPANLRLMSVSWVSGALGCLQQGLLLLYPPCMFWWESFSLPSGSCWRVLKVILLDFLCRGHLYTTSGHEPCFIHDTRYTDLYRLYAVGLLTRLFEIVS